MSKPKVICIGWHKTGTTTLGDALLKLGYSVVGARLDVADDLLKGNVAAALDVAAQFEALQDVPWNALYQELDQKFPGSRFILTIRDDQKWLNSALKHFGSDYSPMREWLYGTGALQGNESLYLERYRKHNREVLEHFANRPADLLIMDLPAGDGWEKLCSFLGCPVPSVAFPHSNKAKHSYTTKDKIVEFLKGLIPQPLRKVRMALLRAFGRPDPRYRFNNREQNTRVREKLMK